MGVIPIAVEFHTQTRGTKAGAGDFRREFVFGNLGGEATEFLDDRRAAASARVRVPWPTLAVQTPVSNAPRRNRNRETPRRASC